jgi:DsbC/DsbD-like thiol-disulfide interchange protein
MMLGQLFAVASQPFRTQMMRMHSVLHLIPFLAASLATAPALASSTDWYEVEGGAVRLITSGKPDAEGRFSGMLDIMLKPGWKTYWRDPGDAGVPPQVDISGSTNIKSAELDFPAPRHHDDGFNTWAGYDTSVAFPITFTVDAPAEASTLEASVFLGICETICIPVQTNFTLDPGADPDNPDDAADVKAAFDRLPRPANPDFSVRPVSTDAGTMLLQAVVLDEPETAELFVAADAGYVFAQAERIEKDGQLFFSVKVLDKPAAIPTGPGLHYTLVTSAGAASGLLPYP